MDNENQNEMPHGFETWCQFLKKAMEDCPDEVNKPNGKIRMQYLSPNDGEITEIFDVIDVKAMAMDEVMKIMPLENLREMALEMRDLYMQFPLKS